MGLRDESAGRYVKISESASKSSGLFVTNGIQTSIFREFLRDFGVLKRVEFSI